MPLLLYNNRDRMYRRAVRKETPIKPLKLFNRSPPNIAPMVAPLYIAALEIAETVPRAVELRV